MKKQIKWGVIASGGIARRRTIPEGIVASENSTLIAVYDIDEKTNKSVAKEFNAIAFNNLDDFLNLDIDAVYIASPTYAHYDHVVACAKAKKHILCEKPLGMNAQEIEAMIKICHSEGVLLGSGFMMRYLSQHQEALKLIREGKLGKVVYGRAQLSCWYPPIEGVYRQDPKKGGGGSLMDLGGHCIDLLEMFLGKVKSVSCFINNNVHSYKSEDSAIVSLFFENGAMATVDTFFCIPDNSSKNVLELYGSKGSILAKGTIGQGDSGEMTAYLEGGDEAYNAQQTRATGGGMSINPTPVNTFKAMVMEFSSAILENRRPDYDYETVLSNQKVLDACYKSAKTGKIEEIV